jgi:hypothetical protein
VRKVSKQYSEDFRLDRKELTLRTKDCYEKGEIFKELLVANDEDQKNTVKVMYFKEERLDSLINNHHLLLKEVSLLNACSMSISEVVRKVVKEEKDTLERKTSWPNLTCVFKLIHFRKCLVLTILTLRVW